MLYVELANGTSFHTPVRDEAVEAELQACKDGQFLLSDERLAMTWLSQDQAIATAPEVFGVTWCLDKDDQVIWSWPDK